MGKGRRGVGGRLGVKRLLRRVLGWNVKNVETVNKEEKGHKQNDGSDREPAT